MSDTHGRPTAGAPANALRAALESPWPQLQNAALAIAQDALESTATLKAAAEKLGVSEAAWRDLRRDHPRVAKRFSGVKLYPVTVTINGWLDWEIEAPDAQAALDIAESRAAADLDPGEYEMEAYLHPYEGGSATATVKVPESDRGT